MPGHPKELSEIPEVPGIPEVPAHPEVPEVPGIPEVPARPEALGIPEVSGIPEVPASPEVPGSPEVPEIRGIPVAYVWFCGTTMRDAQGRVAWNVTGPCRIQEYFYRILAVTLLHVPTVVLLTDSALQPHFQQRYPAEARRGLRVYEYLEYADAKYFKLQSLYLTNLKEKNESKETQACCRGHTEPFEMMNVLSFFVMRAWMEKEAVPHVAYAESDVAVLVPPYLPQRCESEITWRSRWDRQHEWPPFTYSALASTGGVLSLAVLNDWTDFNLALFKEYFWIQEATAVQLGVTFMLKGCVQHNPLKFNNPRESIDYYLLKNPNRITK